MKRTNIITAFIAFVVCVFCYSVNASPPGHAEQGKAKSFEPACAKSQSTKPTVIASFHAYDATLAIAQASACAEQTITAEVVRYNWLNYDADLAPRVHPIYLAICYDNYSLPHPGQSGHYRYLNGIKAGLPYARQL